MGCPFVDCDAKRAGYRSLKGSFSLSVIMEERQCPRKEKGAGEVDVAVHKS